MNVIHTQKIVEFLRGPYAEGPQQLVGYIPCNLTTGGTANYKGGANPSRYIPMGISGVTIATGIDLGQQSAKVMGKVGIPALNFVVFLPYLGKRKKDAVMALHEQPLKISKAEADILDNAMTGHYLELTAKRYDRDAGAGSFGTLPWQAQAVIHSILFQRGTGSPKNFPNTWKALVKRDWKDASGRFCNKLLWNGYHNRRNREGQLLQDLI